MANQLTIQASDGPISIAGLSPPRVRRITEAGVDFFEMNLGEAHEHFSASLGCVPEVVIANVGPLDCATVHEVVTKLIAYIKYVIAQFESEFT